MKPAVVCCLLLTSAGCATRPTYSFTNLPRPVVAYTPEDRCFARERVTLVEGAASVAWVDVEDHGTYASVTTGDASRGGLAFHQDGAVVGARRMVPLLGDPVVEAGYHAHVDPLRRRWHTRIALSIVGIGLVGAGLAAMLGALAFPVDDVRFAATVGAGGGAVLVGLPLWIIGQHAIKTIGGKLDVVETLFTNRQVADRLAAAVERRNIEAAARCGLGEGRRLPPLEPPPVAAPAPTAPAPTVPAPPAPARQQPTGAFE